MMGAINDGSLTEKVLVTIAAVAAITLIEIIDYVFNVPFELSIVYIVPVLIVTWVISYRTGIVLAVFAGLLCLFVTMVTEPEMSRIAILFNEAITLGVTLGGVYIVALYKTRFIASTSDFLTGVANARRFYEVLELEAARARRYHQPFTIVFLDLDDFKNINDAHGHAAGDDVLCEVADCLLGETRDTDIVARLGGDEFMILMPEADPDSARATMERLRTRLAETLAAIDREVTFSAGVVTFAVPAETTRTMVAEADMLMYAAKARGKNAVLYKLNDLAMEESLTAAKMS
jgi:diguanylate cyclase (GGDEF)-like protein